MKSTKIILGLVLNLTILLATNVYAIEANNTFELSLISNDWTNAVVDLHVINPSNQEIASVQSWLEFDINKLKWKSIETNSSPFDFVIPWESNFDWNIVKIWRSSLWWDTSWEKIFVARIMFDIISSWWEIKFHDYQPGEWWHVSIQVFDNWFPINTLQWEPSSLKLEDSQEQSVQVEEVTNPVWNTSITSPVKETTLERPANLMITSTPWNVTVKWDKVTGANNYYLYYSKSSWRYLNRRMVWNTDIYKLQWMETWVQYFFAITAVWENANESDYSNETAIIIWNPNTSTSPLIKKDSNITWNKIVNQIKNVIKKDSNKNIWAKWINKNSETWPKEILMISTILAVIISMYFHRKKKYC